jgi:hypothetical protein
LKWKCQKNQYFSARAKSSTLWVFPFGRIDVQDPKLLCIRQGFLSEILRETDAFSYAYFTKQE